MKILWEKKLAFCKDIFSRKAFQKYCEDFAQICEICENLSSWKFGPGLYLNPSLIIVFFTFVCHNNYHNYHLQLLLFPYICCFVRLFHFFCTYSVVCKAFFSKKTTFSILKFSTPVIKTSPPPDYLTFLNFSTSFCWLGTSKLQLTRGSK